MPDAAIQKVVRLEQLVDAILKANPGLADNFDQADNELVADLRAELAHTDEPAS